MPELDPDWCIAPGVTIAESMSEWHLSSGSMARMLDLHEYQVDELLAGKREIGFALASRLQAAFGVSADVWLALERQYRDGLAAGKKDITNEDHELPTPTDADRLHRGGGGSRFDEHDD